VTTISICLTCGSDISSRKCAAQLRAEILQVIGCSQSVVLDFDGVRTISDSFADELFGILALELGAERFRANVSLANLSDLSRDTIVAAIENRLSNCAA
jgi:hypothetical protein